MPQDFELALVIAAWLTEQTGANVAMELDDDAILLHYYANRPPCRIENGTVVFPAGSAEHIVSAYIGTR